MKWKEIGENCIMKRFITSALRHYIIRTIKSRRMRWTGHATCMGEKRNVRRKETTGKA
jgi:hypothetical protein